MIAAQYGTVFTSDNYDDVNKVYSIWLCTDPPANRYNTITCYEITERNIIGDIHEEHSKYDLQTVVMICTAKDTSKTTNPLLKLLSIIFNQGNRVKDLEDKLSSEYGIDVTPDLKERMKNMCNLSYSIEKRGYERGYNTGYNSGLDDGSILRGEQCANDMFTDNKPFDEIVRYSGLTSERVREIGIAGGFIKE